jgi:hypothetical protein
LLVKNFTLILLLGVPLALEAKQECYLFPVAAQPRERERLDQWSRALFHEFVVPI